MPHCSGVEVTSRIVSLPRHHTPVRAAVLDLVGRRTEPLIGADEAEFLAALRRIVEQVPALDLWEKYRGAEQDSSSRVFARFAD